MPNINVVSGRCKTKKKTAKTTKPKPQQNLFGINLFLSILLLLISAYIHFVHYFINLSSFSLKKTRVSARRAVWGTL